MRPRVLFLSGREVEYIRNRVLLAALQRYCDVTVLTGGGRSIIARSIGSIFNWGIHRPAYDVALAGFYGQLIAIILALLQRRPVILDAYVSTYDTLCEDRKLFHPNSIPGRLTYWIDQKSYQLANIILTDTWANARYFSNQFGIPLEKFRVIYVGCDDSIFYPKSDITPPSSHCEVFYYSSFLPLHGIEVIIQAAALLKDRKDIHFTIGGHGPLFKSVKQMIKELSLENVSLVGWIPLEQLPLYIAKATICLGGHFSTTPKAARVISTKTFQFIAMRKPTIVGDNMATKELFAHCEHVYTVPMGNPAALAEAIILLIDDWELCCRISQGGYELFRQRLATQVVAERLTSIMEEIS